MKDLILGLIFSVSEITFLSQEVNAERKVWLYLINHEKVR